MAQQVKFFKDPFWVVIDNKARFATVNTKKLQNTPAKVRGTYFVKDIGQMFLLEYTDISRGMARSLAAIINPSQHYTYVGQGKKSDPPKQIS